MFNDIKAIVMDVDGVLTDGTFWWGTNGEEIKRFCFADVTGIALAREAGLHMALVSGESSPAGMTLVQRFADKAKIVDVYKGCHDKAAAVRQIADKYQLQLSEVCFIGDDLIDLPAMSIVGLAVAPLNAIPAVRDKAGLITSCNGGTGVVREIVNAILAQKART